MQTRPTARLARKMAKYRQNHSLRKTAIKFDIRGRDKKYSTGLVSQLITGLDQPNGYDPSDPDTRLRCHLPARKPIEHYWTKARIEKELKRPIADMNPFVLKLALMFREDF